MTCARNTFSVVRTFTKASETGQQSPKSSEKGPIAIHRPPSEYAEVRVLRVARRAIRQFCRENVLLHEGQVITSEAQLAVIFGQRVVDNVPATIAVGTQTPKRRRETAATRHRQHWTSLARSHEHLAAGSARPLRAVLFKRARWKLPTRIAYLTFNVNSMIRSGRVRLMLRYLNSNSSHAAGLQGTRIPGDSANTPRYHVIHWGYGSNSLEQVNKCTGVSLILDTRVFTQRTRLCKG